ncbi:hypothetical protein TGARI_365840 [Toxoplasma gondii ARI]|uniref:Uncharacterized protein n=1 Tax=Toxoplasma gondii ARI TaxID=1074872 RepID=A0A139XID6_TOXGO|nr:hypothetical protein TGARI_365840 [Toxoplasma gondii ARI]
MAIVRLNSQCHLATDFAGCRMLSWTPKFVSNRRFRGITPCTVVVCMLLLLSPEAPVAFRWPFHHPAHPQWTNSGVPQFLFASAAEQTQTPEHGTESETDGVDTQAQSEQPPAIRRRTRYGRTKKAGAFTTASASCESRSKCGSDELGEPLKFSNWFVSTQGIFASISDRQTEAEAPEAATEGWPIRRREARKQATTFLHGLC